MLMNPSNNFQRDFSYCILIMGFMIISQFMRLSKFGNSSHSYDQQRKRVIKCYTPRNDRESDRVCVCAFACR